MMPSFTLPTSLLLVIALGVSGLVGCASEQVHREGLQLIREGKTEEGLAVLEKAVTEEPRNAVFRKDLYHARETYLRALSNQAESQRQKGQLSTAEAIFNKMLAYDPYNEQARSGLRGLVRDRQLGNLLAKAQEAFKNNELDLAERLLRPVLVENSEFPPALNLRQALNDALNKRQQEEPLLDSKESTAINVEFRDANVRMVFEALSRSSGLNFILDKDIRPDLRTNVFLKNAAIEDAIELILQTSQLQKKTLNSNTLLIYPNTPEKLKEHQELVVKTFYLKNADSKQVQNTLKTLLKAKDVVIDEKLNLVLMRDTPEAMKLAEKLIAAQDLAEPEVMLEVEVLEVQRSRLIELGIQWPTQMALTPLNTNGGTSLTVNDLKNLNSSRIGVGVGPTTVNLRQELGDANLLANPRIRVRNREKAKIMVGDKIPIVTTTTTSNGLVSDNVQYMDVGLRVELEPNIHLQSEVAIKVGLEVSALGTQVTTPSGTVAYQIGTRNATTVLRLKDGETQILAGLLNDEERNAAVGLPGLSSLPVVGRLFSSQENSKKKTEIVLSITPHLIRHLERPEASQSEFWSGSETTLRTKPLGLRPAQTTGADVANKTTEAGQPVTPALISNQARTALPSAQNVGLSWTGPSEINVGDTFKVQLKVKTDGVLRSLPFQGSFDPAALQIVEISEGGFFKQQDNASSFSHNIDSSGGKFYVSTSRTHAQGAHGEGIAATFTLRAIATHPKTEITLRSITPITDASQAPVTPLPAPYTITIK